MQGLGFRVGVSAIGPRVKDLSPSKGVLRAIHGYKGEETGINWGCVEFTGIGG